MNSFIFHGKFTACVRTDHRSQESLARLFIVFKVQILKSFVSRVQFQIARKYCFCVFNRAAVSWGNFILSHSL